LLREIVWQTAGPETPPPSLAVWAGGDRLVVQGIAAGKARETCELRGAGWRLDGLPLTRVRAVENLTVQAEDRDAQEEFDRARAEPPRGRDLLAVRSEGRARVAACVVAGLGEAGPDVLIEGTPRTVAWRDVVWLVLAPTEAPGKAEGHGLALADGTTLTVGALRLEGGQVTGAAQGAEFRADASCVRRLRVRSDAYAYLSDLQPTRVDTEPFLDVVWPPRTDRCVAGGPLSLGGRAYARGIGMHTRTAMEFALGGRFSKFYATVGVDDAAGRLGAVVFRVTADGRKVKEVGPLRGGDAPVAIALDVQGVQALTLLSGFGDQLTASGNFADWAEARVVAESAVRRTGGAAP
jgi:hypothetical protein